ncbi:MAG: hypothetical protein A7315_09035 [Candidatus Altiarchaeales archaeon WOR_SM1_79]|nr:MAG: hypothetical protein A7315_09035 [Candidatus Altiarchaeales archaeon WOR_SM1_79]
MPVIRIEKEEWVLKPDLSIGNLFREMASEYRLNGFETVSLERSYSDYGDPLAEFEKELNDMADKEKAKGGKVVIRAALSHNVPYSEHYFKAIVNGGVVADLYGTTIASTTWGPKYLIDKSLEDSDDEEVKKALGIKDKVLERYEHFFDIKEGD